MRLLRFLAAVSFGLLIGWGGLGMPHGAMAGVLHHATGSGAGSVAAADCDEPAEHRGRHDHRHQGEAEHREGHEDRSKASHTGCCVVACGFIAALDAPSFQLSAAGYSSIRVRFLTDDPLRKRTVSPLRRPPRVTV
jgi:hypothetical protein